MQIERDYCQKQLSLKSQSFWYVRQAQKKVQRKNYSSARYLLELLR